MARITIVALLLGLTAGACSASEPEATPPGPGRLAIVDGGGNVAVIDRSGEQRVDVTTDAGDDAVYVQPTWSPDGRYLAFARASTSGSETVVHDLTTAASEATETDSPAFYFSWSPSSDVVASLGTSLQGGIHMEVVDTGGDVVRTDTGQPYYLSWGDNGSMVTHIGLDGLAVVDAAGDPADWPLDAPGLFRAPQWTESGILYLDDVGRLVLADGGESKPIAAVIGGATFAASPAGDRVAVQSVDGASSDDFAVNARHALAQEVPTLPSNRLVVVDVETLEWTRVADDGVVAYFWSPSGDHLLVLGLHEGRVGTLEWRIWSDGSIGQPVVFAPHPAWVRDVLPFFDQYAQSASLWAPDGTAFAFPGTIDEEQGIHVVDLAGPEPAPTFVADGSWVAWGDG